MALGRKTGGRDFKPGQSGNPKGRPKLAPEIKAIREADSEEIILLLHEFLSQPYQETLKDYQSRTGTTFEQMVSGLIVRCVDHGDSRALETILDRLVGPITKTFDVTLPEIPRAQFVEPDSDRADEKSE